MKKNACLILLLSYCLISCEQRMKVSGIKNVVLSAGNPDCFQTEQMCSDSACWQEIAAYHSITEEKFGYMISSVNPMQEYTGSGLENLKTSIDQAGCNDTVYIGLDGSVEVGSSLEGIKYSVPLFRGILMQDPDKLSTYNAKDMTNGVPDRIISIETTDGLRFYNLNNSFP
jgi:hypothetical protein